MRYALQKILLTKIGGSWSDVPCVLWDKHTERSGYGRATRRGKKYLAHRVAWEDANGPIPPGLYVCHKCDVPNCVEPRHLFLGTHQDNMTDKANKGRGVAGDKHPNSRLTEAQVVEIRVRAAAGGWGTQAKLAREMGVSRPQISHIVHGKAWQHVLPK